MMMVSSWPATLRCGAFASLALLLAAPLSADDALHEMIRRQLRDESFVLVEDQHGIRLFVFSSADDSFQTTLAPVTPGLLEQALAMTQSEVARERVLGLTTLAGEPAEEALNAALVLLTDPDPAVREEAVNLIIDHPRGDVASVIAIAVADPSPRVRDAVEDLFDDVEED